MQYIENEIVTAKIIKIKDARINVLLPKGETTTIDPENFCSSPNISLKNRVSVGDEIKIQIKGYSEETGKIIANHRTLLGTFIQNLSLISIYSRKGNFISSSVTATVTDTNSYRTTAEITPNLYAQILNGKNYGLEKFDKVLVTLKNPEGQGKLFCTIDHVYYDEKNYLLNNWSYFDDDSYGAKIS